MTEFAALSAELGESQGAVALAWLLHQPGVTSVIAGPGSRAQLDSALHAVDLNLGAEILARIDAIFPPIGQAPEAYAW